MAKILVLLGPTAVGKTACIQEIATEFSAVIYADTACLYKDLHVGTAKPSLQEQAGLPHYLIDVLDLQENFDAGAFFSQAEFVCTKYQDAKPLILTGGTLFYIQNFLFGLSGAPAAQPQTRTYWQQQLAQQGLPALRDLLQQIDPLTASRLKTNDSYRITRALEVYTDTGQALSTFPTSQTLRSDHEWLIIQLERPRDILYQRINQRVEMMWHNGLTEEVHTLIKDYGAQKDWSAMKAIGYREFFLDLPNATAIKEQIQQDTRNYAKRQLTFLNRLPVHFFCEAENLRRLTKIIGNWVRSS